MNVGVSTIGRTPVLRAEGVRKVFGGFVALTNVSLEIDRGEIVGVIGPNGAGKSTLMNILVGALHPEGGRVLLGGTNATNWSTQRHCHWGVALARQIPRPLHGMSVMENTMVGAIFGCRPTRKLSHATAFAADVLERVGLSKFSRTMAADLSVQQLKLLELARALATEPQLLILDETMAGLGEGEVSEVADVIRSERDSGLAIALIEHRLMTVWRLCDRVCVLDSGRMISSGTPAEVRADPLVHEAYFARSARAAQHVAGTEVTDAAGGVAHSSGVVTDEPTADDRA